MGSTAGKYSLEGCEAPVVVVVVVVEVVSGKSEPSSLGGR